MGYCGEITDVYGMDLNLLRTFMGVDNFLKKV